jgi:hypothetical protein
LGIAGTNFPVHTDHYKIKNKSDIFVSTPHEQKHKRNNSALHFNEDEHQNSRPTLGRGNSPLVDTSKLSNYQLNSIDKNANSNLKVDSMSIPSLKLSTIAIPQGNISSLPFLANKEESFSKAAANNAFVVSKTQRTKPIANIVKAKANK